MPLRAIALMTAVICVAAAQTDRPVTYLGDIRTLLRSHCVQCHRPGQVAPMSLQTYEEVRPWAQSVAQQVGNRLMPPFHAAGPPGRFNPDPRLTDEEIARVLAWVEKGAPRGQEDEKGGLDFVSAGELAGWQLGPPDVAIDFLEHYIIDDGGLAAPYVHLVTDYEFDSDRWVSGFEWRFSDHRIVHHALVRPWVPRRVMPAAHGQSPPAPAAAPIVASWLPGQPPEWFPSGSAMLIPKGTRLQLSAHYAGLAEGVMSKVRLGVHFFDGDLTSPQWTMVAAADNPPSGAVEFSMALSTRIPLAIPFDALVQAFSVHMDPRGKRAAVSTMESDSTTALFELPQYHVDWQWQYRLAEPVRVSAGAGITAEMEWDLRTADSVPAANPHGDMAHVQIVFAPDNVKGDSVRVINGQTSVPTDELPETFRPWTIVQVQE